MQLFSLHTIEVLAKTIAGTKSASGEDQSMVSIDQELKLRDLLRDVGLIFNLMVYQGILLCIIFYVI